MFVGVLKTFRESRWRWLLAALAALCWTLAFPKAAVAGLGWLVAPLLLLATAGLSGREAFRWGFIAGFLHKLSSLYWLIYIPFPAGAITGWIALSAFFALLTGGWCWLCWYLWPGSALLTTPRSRHAALSEYAAPGVAARMHWMLAAAALWVTTEWMQGWLLTGFPWNFLGASQQRMTPLIQIASITGVHGVSFLMVWVGLSLGSSLTLLLHDPKRWAWRWELVFPFAVEAVVIWFGFVQMFRPMKVRGEITAALIQPSIPQLLLWDGKETPKRFARMLEHSGMAMNSKPSVIVWPEASLPAISEEQFRALTEFASSNRVWMILGADDAKAKSDQARDGYYYFNAALMLNPEGKVAGIYHKRHLVPFGEFVPFADWLPFLSRWLPIGDGFKAGKTVELFRLKNPDVVVAPLICFEDVFARESREAAQSDVDILLNLTNNGWFGESAAQWQHAQAAAFRAIETGLPLIRCTNNGLTCWIDPLGRFMDIFGTTGEAVYGEGFKVVRAPLLTKSNLPRTFYRAHGDLFTRACLAGSVVILFLCWNRKRKTKAA